MEEETERKKRGLNSNVKKWNGQYRKWEKCRKKRRAKGGDNRGWKEMKQEVNSRESNCKNIRQGGSVKISVD